MAELMITSRIKCETGMFISIQSIPNDRMYSL